MTDKEIFKKAVLKAIRNGFFPKYTDWCIEAIFDENLTLINKHGIIFNHISRESIIFSPDFAKAFWGERKECKCSGICIQYQGCSCGSKQSGWQYHLQQMVLEENPLQYLERFL